MKPFSQACENNKQAILDILRPALEGVSEVLEIGSGTGQHACYFAAQMPQLRWQPSDRPEYLDGIRAWITEAALPNLSEPLQLDVCQPDWPVPIPQALFMANTLHIMPFSAVEVLFSRLAQLAPMGNRLLVYGPFNYGGEYTSDSNARFDEWLAQQHPESAIRDFEAVDTLASAAGYRLLQDHAMPANNRLLHWRREAAVLP